MSTALRLVGAVVVLLLGAVCALAAVLVHADWWGVALCWAVLVTLVVALPRGWFGRPAFALGWAGVLVACLGTRPEGDFLVASNLAGYLLLATAPVLVVTAIAGLARREVPAAEIEDPRPLGVPS